MAKPSATVGVLVDFGGFQGAPPILPLMRVSCKRPLVFLTGLMKLTSTSPLYPPSASTASRGLAGSCTWSDLSRGSGSGQASLVHVPVDITCLHFPNLPFVLLSTSIKSPVQFTTCGIVLLPENITGPMAWDSSQNCNPQFLTLSKSLFKT